jgi:CheY-like chemotaxis protein
MDLRMPHVNGLEATAQITTAHPDIAIFRKRLRVHDRVTAINSSTVP